MDHNTIEFARLWGQFESEVFGETVKIAADMRQYDSTGLVELLTEWTYEYVTDYEFKLSTYDFFCQKLNELYGVHVFS